MGQAGSVEQRNAIRDVINLKPTQESSAMVSTLHAFCRTFPMDAAAIESAPTRDDGAVVDVKESKLFHAMHALLQHATERTEKNSKEELIELTLTSFKRVIMWRELYRLGAKCSMKPFLSCLLLSPVLKQSALLLLLDLTGVCPGPESNEKTDKWETLNRHNLAESGGYDVLRSLIVDSSHTQGKDDHDGVLALALEMFHAALVTRRHTSDAPTITLAVGALLNARIALLALCHHANRRVQELAIDLVKDLFMLIDLEQVHELQESAREYGVLLYALSAAVSEPPKAFDSEESSEEEATATLPADATATSTATTKESKLTPTNSARTVHDKLVELVEMFCAGNTRSKKAISRVLPVELFIPLENRADLISRHTASSLLKSTRNNRSLPSFTFDFELRSSMDSKRARGSTHVGSAGSKNATGTSAAFERWLHEARMQGEDWKKIMASVHETHERPDLVWRDSMREELRHALRMEIDKLEAKTKALPADTAVKWDHEVFHVDYQSIHRELVVNGYFVEHLIPRLADLTSTFEVVEPFVFAWHLSDRLAIETNEHWRILCLRCLRLAARRYAMILQGQLPTCHVLELLHDHALYSPAFIRECFLLLNTAIMTTLNAPSDILNRTSTLEATAVVDVLSNSVLIASLSRPPSSWDNRRDSAQHEDMNPAYDFDEEPVHVRNVSDGLIRAGVSVLQAIIRRAKYTLQIVRPKRVFICRLLAVETLDHVTVGRILAILKQLAHLETSPASIQSMGSSKVDANWKSLALVYILIASCDPNGRGMSRAAAAFLQENYFPAVSPPPITTTTTASSAMASPKPLPRTPLAKASRSTSSDASAPDHQSTKSELKELLNDALGFNGCGMGPLLECCDAEVFCEIFNADEKRSADVLWGSRQRARLFRYLKRKFVATSSPQSAMSNQAEDNDFAVVSASDTSDHGVDDDFQDEDIFVGNIFLKSYVEGDGEFLTHWTPEMYRTLVHALFARLTDLGRTKSVFGVNDSHQYHRSSSRTASEPWEIQVLILKALVRLLPTHCATVDFSSEFFETLMLPLRRTLLGKSDQIRSSLALELIVTLLQLPEETTANAVLCRKFLADRGLATISEALEKMLNPSYQQLLTAASTTEARTLLSRATQVLTTLCTGMEGVRAIEKNPGVISALLSLSSRQIIASYAADAASECLLCLMKLCQYDELHAVLVGAGGLLQLIDVCAFCPIGSDLTEPVRPRRPIDTDENEANNDVAGDEIGVDDEARSLTKLSPVSATVRDAASTLQVCLRDSDGGEAVAAIQVLKQLLTPSFVRILRLSPERFLLRLQSKDDISSSTLIWTSSMKKRLADTLAVELTKVKTAMWSDVWPRWNPDHFVAADSFRYQYPELADELIVHDVYINKFVSSDGVSLQDVDLSEFSQALLISIQSGENVLRILQQRGFSDTAKERSLVVMRLALNKLVTMHPQHNLQVDRTPASIGMTSLIEYESSDEGSDDDDDTSTAGSSVGGGYRIHGEQALERSSMLDMEDLTV